MRAFGTCPALLSVLGLPLDERLVLEVSWAPALAQVSTSVHLPGLADTAAGAVRLMEF